MLAQWLERSLAFILFALVVVECDNIRVISDPPVQPERRSLSERIAFACAHKPTLSFCTSTSGDVPTTTSAPIIDSAREASSIGSRQPISPNGPSAQQTAQSPEAARRSDSPPPKRRVRWVFVPHSGPAGGDSRFWDDLAKSARSSPVEGKEANKAKEPEESTELPLIVPPEPYTTKRGASAPTRALQSRTFPVLPSDAAYGAGQVHAADGNPFSAFDSLTDEKGLAHRPRSRSPFTKPGLWEPNPDDPHSRDPANKWWYKPESVGVDWLNGQLQWGGHWAVPAAGVGGTNGQSSLHFPSIGTFLGIPDDYD